MDLSDIDIMVVSNYHNMLALPYITEVCWSMISKLYNDDIMISNVTNIYAGWTFQLTKCGTLALISASVP